MSEMPQPVPEPVESPTDTILIIEDEDLIRISLKTRLEKLGYEVLEAATGLAGLKILEETFVDLILLDYKLPDLDGLEVMRRIHGTNPSHVTIMMTAYSTVEGVVEAMQLGAFTYVKKPFEFSEMLENIRRGLETTKLRREVDRLRRQAAAGHAKAPALIGSSPAMQEIDALIAKLNAAGTTTCLITGPSGSGKNVVARRLHYTSSRADQAFMTITCTDFSENLLESELFGHQKGAFTGAVSAKPGLFELADGGTIFFDEIGDMPLSLQTKLLRFLEERTFRRVGGTREFQVNVRVIAATNQDLDALMKEGLFREDLYFRLAVVPLVVPSLADRHEDIEPLATMFIDRLNREFHRNIEGLEPDALRALRGHGWPGNVRELRNVIERAMILAAGPTIGLEDLPPDVADRARTPLTATTAAARVLGPEGFDFEAFERDLIRRALELTGGNQSAAARLLHMSRDQIRYRMEKFKIEM